MEGQLNNQAAQQRTQDVKDVIATPDCSFIKIIDLQTADWQRDQAQSLMANWLTTGTPFDAVISNNDEMAIGALQAMKAAGIDTSKVIIGGVDATQEALAPMKAGDLKVTVFQDAAGQGKGALDTALTLAKGEKVDKAVWVPFKLVTPENIGELHVEELRPRLTDVKRGGACNGAASFRSAPSNGGETKRDSTDPLTRRCIVTRASERRTNCGEAPREGRHGRGEQAWPTDGAEERHRASQRRPWPPEVNILAGLVIIAAHLRGARLASASTRASSSIRRGCRS